VQNGDGSYARNGRSAKAGLNRAILDVAPGEFRRQITYKTRLARRKARHSGPTFSIKQALFVLWACESQARPS